MQKRTPKPVDSLLSKWHFEVRNRAGEQLMLVQRKTKSGIPRCLHCDKPIPRFRRSRRWAADSAAAFHADSCAIRFAESVVREICQTGDEHTFRDHSLGDLS